MRDRGFGSKLVSGSLDGHQDAFCASACEVTSRLSSRSEPNAGHIQYFALHLPQAGEGSRIECVSATETPVSLLSNRQDFGACVVGQGECFAVSPLHIMRGHLIE